MNQDAFFRRSDELLLLEAWLHEDSQPPAKLLERWLRHSDTHIMYRLAQNAPWIDAKLARQIYELTPKHKFDLVYTMTQNPSLSADTVAAVAEWLVDDWEAQIRSRPSVIARPWDCFCLFLYHHFTAVLVDLVRRVYTFPQLARELGVSYVDIESYLVVPVDERCKRFTQSETALTYVGWLSRRILQLQIPVPPDILCEAIPFVDRNPNELRTLLDHPSVDTTVLRAAIKRNPRSWAAQYAVAHDDNLRWDPEIRPLLLDTDCPAVLAKLAEDADPKTTIELLRRLIDLKEFDRVADILRTAESKDSISLNPNDLLPLLSHSDRHIRLTALTHLGRLGKSTNPESDTPIRTGHSRS